MTKIVNIISYDNNDDDGDDDDDDWYCLQMMWKQASDTEQDFIECNVERDQVNIIFMIVMMIGMLITMKMFFRVSDTAGRVLGSSTLPGRTLNKLLPPGSFSSSSLSCQAMWFVFCQLQNSIIRFLMALWQNINTQAFQAVHWEKASKSKFSPHSTFWCWGVEDEGL